MVDFAHLHVHTQYSLLDGAASIGGLMKKAKADGMKAVALTDHGNMFGAFKFVAEADKHGVKPIVGCEFYVVEDRFQKNFTKENKDKRYHQLLLAKNAEGYKNLSKLCSLGYMEGMYSKWPRIDKELVLKYSKGLIATTCCIGAEVPQTILRKGVEEGEEIFKWWLDVFGEDYYIELQRHNLQNIDGSGMSQEDVNQVLLKWGEKYNVKVIATNDTHYLDQQDFSSHDILLCVNTGELKNTPIGDGKGFRFGFPNDQFFFKTQAEMLKLFHDVPFAVDNTIDIVDKVEHLKLKRDILLPAFALPQGFKTENDYLRHLTFEGAKHRYGTISAEIEERLNFELDVISKMGFAGYFLIVADFIAVAKKIGVAVGPGRGSAAGAAVAYCTGITNIDPIRYNLLFERFLNPERVSMPDIDIDFDDHGRQRVIDYVVDKYGKNSVAQIITFGTMAAKSSIRDVSRVLDLPLSDADRIAKLVPDRPGTNLNKLFASDSKGLKEQGFNGDDLAHIEELIKLSKGNDLPGQVIKNALSLEGSVRNTGIHAAGVIIAPGDLTDYIPVSTSKDADLLVTQFDGKLIEDAGMLKMDFLGLKTLTILRDAADNVKKARDIDINFDELPLDDQNTFELYQRGDTIGTFQFESEGMRGYLRQLKPTDIEDLIAMNALYRPGPMDFIPNFINRKHGKEEVIYPHPLLEEILSPTYGIMVYQEQIMQTAQIIGGFSLGKADILRRAMGKKQHDKMQAMKSEFVKGAAEKDIDEKKASEIFEVMEKFASYGFNRSHSAAYSVLAYHTAYMKANYLAEYMAAVLANNMNDIKKVIFFMDECRTSGQKVLGPDINESSYKFIVNKKGQIRFGLGAIKGVGEAAVRAIEEERDQNGRYTNFFDFIRRVNLRAVNKKSIENLASAGAFDCFEDIHRAQYFHVVPGDTMCLIEKAIRFANQAREVEAQAANSLFGGSDSIEFATPAIPECEPWPKLERLQKERQLIGFYVTGHPLDDFAFEIKHMCRSLANENLETYKGRSINVGGIVTSYMERVTKRGGRKFGIITIEDFMHSLEFTIMGDDYGKYKHLFEVGNFVFINGMVELRYNKEDEYTVKPKEVHFLEEVREKLLSSINLNLELNKVNESLIGKLEGLVTTHQGKVGINFKIFDTKENLSLEMRSKKHRINPTNEFFNELSAVKSISLSLNLNC